jgi:hypothetical protein
MIAGRALQVLGAAASNGHASVARLLLRKNAEIKSHVLKCQQFPFWV